MAVAKAQLPIDLPKTQAQAAAEAAEADERRDQRAVLRVKLMAALRACAAGQIAMCAREVTRDAEAFGTDRDEDTGKGVSESLLAACLRGSNRNYFRLDWLLWFAEESEEVREVLLEIVGRGKGMKDPKDELRDLKEVLRNEYPKQAERLIKKGQLL